MHLRYAFCNENASIPNMSCGSWVTIFGVHLGRPHILFGIAIMYFPSFLMPGREYGIA